MDTGGEKKIAIFASGSGTNAENIIRYFRKAKSAEVIIILTNNKDAYVIERARKLGVECLVFNRNTFYETEKILDILKKPGTDIIVLAGFLWLVPGYLLRSFPGKIINIHPALLPKYGGKGMYGHVVHEAVIRSGDPESGITIHYVNEKYDEGTIIFQTRCAVQPGFTPNDLAEKIHELEYKYYPEVIEKVLFNDGKAEMGRA
ncbi:MAG TPA: phosphoribosylglycinamide formyltransferase [Cyclobacteriaceae bacterium]|nr:phosphoribosylglycinamide formyltransferase [Cyclobacteriaceae bacterium]